MPVFATAPRQALVQEPENETESLLESLHYGPASEDTYTPVIYWNRFYPETD